MDRSTAENVLDKIKAWDAVFGDLHAISLQLSENEAQRLRHVIGGLVVDIYAGIVRPIVAQYPDLDPDRENAE